MADFVLDASLALTWCFEDETHPLADSVAERLRAGTRCMVPAIWPLEVANAVRTAERKDRISAEQGTRFLESLQDLPILLTTHHLGAIVDRVMPLARQHELSSYDASYLAVALDEGLPLATLDGKLRDAAGAAGVSLVEE
jgi:predicted nucleic acid-binding protein